MLYYSDQSHTKGAQGAEAMVQEQISLLYVPRDLPSPSTEEDWDYATVYTKTHTHSFHAYPAMMIPQVARRLIRLYGKSGQTLLDPFCGSGTSLVEARLAGLNGYGIDLNPLAVLLARAKTTDLPESPLREALLEVIESYRASQRRGTVSVPRFFNVDYWFSPEVQVQLAHLRQVLFAIPDQAVRQFMLVVLSHTVRECSYTRKGEFKLYRLPESQIRDFRTDVLATFIAKAEQNIQGMAEFNAEVDRRTHVQVFQSDTRQRQPIPDASVDLVVTSPPCGDSQTTVAYGQFSRLSLQWLGLPCEEAKSVDRQSLGGKVQNNVQVPPYLSESLEGTVGQIFQRDARRARQVKAFYDDFAQCLVEITRVCRPGAKARFVVGNRTVRGIRIPTDLILREMAGCFGWQLVEQFERRIPNKRMPLQNSPSNVPGERGETMTREHIVILEKTS